MLKNKKSYIEILVLFIIVMVVKYIFDATSRLDYSYSGDSPIFSMIGQAWSDGVIPYRDLFDHKGPILFLFYAIASHIKCGLVGLMIVTGINLTIVLKLILSISKKFLANQSNKIHYLITALSFVFFQLIRESAGVTEELSLVFILFPLLLCVKHLTKVIGGGKLFNQHPYSYSFIYGACFAAIAMIRVNNASINVGIVLGFLIVMLKNKCYKELLYNALYCLFGFLAVILPIIAYFSYHDALYEMIYATFIFNWNYRATDIGFHQEVIQNLLWLIPCFYLMVVSILRDRKLGSVYSYFFIPASIICICAFANGFSIGHYFVNVLPYYVLSIIFTYELFRVKQKQLMLIISFILLSPYYPGIKSNIKAAYYNTIGKSNRALLDKNIIEGDKKLITFIPKEDYNSVYSFEALAGFIHLTQNKIYPVGKYFVGQRHQSLCDDKVKSEIDEFHKTTKVKWIVTKFDAISSPSESFKVLLQNYDLVYATEATNLYRRKADAI